MRNTSKGTTKRILVVEDHERVRAAITQVLQSAGYGVLQASDGHDAITMLAGDTPDLVLTDLRLPRLDGVALTQYVNCIDPTLAVIIWAFEDALDAETLTCYCRADAVFSKSVDLADLLACIARVLTLLSETRLYSKLDFHLPSF